MDTMYDAVIAGAGPAGLYAAQCCERRGLDAVVLEEHGKIGEPDHCSGLISSNLGSFVPIKKEFVEHRVSGAVMHAPNGKELVLEKRGVAAYVVSRARFDRFLASRAGSEIIAGAGIDALAVAKGRVIVKAGARAFEARCLLGCDGAGSFVARHFRARPREMLTGIIATAKGSKDERRSDFVGMWYDKALTDGFLWKIPRGDSVEYGMLGSRVSFGVLEKFFKIRGKAERRGGMVPLGPPRTFFSHAMLVGGAAAQVKPWSGGGVIYSLSAAGAAARALEQAKRAGDFGAGSLKTYEALWKRKFGKQIAAGMLGRAIYRKMNNRQISMALGSARAAGPLMNKLDMDFLAK